MVKYLASLSPEEFQFTLLPVLPSIIESAAYVNPTADTPSLSPTSPTQTTSVNPVKVNLSPPSSSSSAHSSLLDSSSTSSSTATLLLALQDRCYSRSGFRRLPSELISHVATFCSVDSLLTINTVSRQWHRSMSSYLQSDTGKLIIADAQKKQQMKERLGKYRRLTPFFG
jgi:hypothetical protein